MFADLAQGLADTDRLWPQYNWFCSSDPVEEILRPPQLGWKDTVELCLGPKKKVSFIFDVCDTMWGIHLHRLDLDQGCRLWKNHRPLKDEREREPQSHWLGKSFLPCAIGGPLYLPAMSGQKEAHSCCFNTFQSALHAQARCVTWSCANLQVKLKHLNQIMVGLDRSCTVWFRCCSKTTAKASQSWESARANPVGWKSPGRVPCAIGLPSLESRLSASTIHRPILAGERSQDGPGCQTTGGILNALIAGLNSPFSLSNFMTKAFQPISTYFNRFQHGFHDFSAARRIWAAACQEMMTQLNSRSWGLLKCVQCTFGRLNTG